MVDQESLMTRVRELKPGDSVPDDISQFIFECKRKDVFTWELFGAMLKVEQPTGKLFNTAIIGRKLLNPMIVAQVYRTFGGNPELNQQDQEDLSMNITIEFAKSLPAFDSSIAQFQTFAIPLVKAAIRNTFGLVTPYDEKLIKKEILARCKNEEEKAEKEKEIKQTLARPRCIDEKTEDGRPLSEVIDSGFDIETEYEKNEGLRKSYTMFEFFKLNTNNDKVDVLQGATLWNSTVKLFDDNERLFNKFADFVAERSRMNVIEISKEDIIEEEMEK